jgi:plastocyanin
MLVGCKKQTRVVTYDVYVSNCGAAPDSVTVHEGDKVHWQPADQHDYAIRFSNSGEPTANPFTVKHGVSNAAHPIKGHTGCTDNGNGHFYCKYSLTKDNETTPCVEDPGVHIVPRATDVTPKGE